MRFTTAAASTSGVVTAIAAVGQPALAGLAILLILLLGTFCWAVTNTTRTRNVVSIIIALRHCEGPDPK